MGSLAHYVLAKVGASWTKTGLVLKISLAV